MSPATPNTACWCKGLQLLLLKGSTICWYYNLFNTPSETATIPASGYTLLGNNAVDAANIASTANKDYCYCFRYDFKCINKGYFIFNSIFNSNENWCYKCRFGERYTTVAALTAASTATSGANGAFVWSTSLSDTVTLTVGSNSVTTS